MKNNFYMILTFVLVLLIAGFFIVKPLINGEKVNSGSSVAQDVGEYQKMVLSMKNYNYYPNTIEVKAGKPVRIYLDNSVQGCYRSIVVPDFNIRKNMPSNQDYVEFTPTKAGTHSFACSMGMGKGKIIVTE